MSAGESQYPAESWQEAYARDYRDLTVRNNRLGCVLGIIFMPFGITLDWFVYPEEVGRFFVLRLLCSVLLAGVWFLFGTQVGRRCYRALGQIEVSLPLAAIAWMIYATEGAASPYYAGLNIVLMGAGLVLRWRSIDNLILAVITLGMYLLACAAHTGAAPKPGIFFNNLYFLIVTWVFIFTGTHFLNLLRKREFALRFQLNQNRMQLAESNRELEENRSQLEKTNNQLRELDRIRSHFFANISHELRTPLTLLLAPLESLINRHGNELPPPVQSGLQTMHSNGMRLLKLINDLLDLVKLESGRIAIHRENIDVRLFVNGLLASVQRMADDKHVTLKTAIAPGAVSVAADRDKLEKILLNLIFNAIKFTPAGGSIEVGFQQTAEQSTLSVRDTGMGISRKDQENLFKRFWQADLSSQRKFQGVGIGLALVKELTEAHGGAVSVVSEENSGTTFTVCLPRVEAPAPATDAGEPPPPEPEPAREEEAVGQDNQWLAELYRRAELFPSLPAVRQSVRPVESDLHSRLPKVLVADDEPDMLGFLRSQLESHYQILEAVDGQQAIEKAAQFLPDVVLLDMMMPEKDGLEACRELRDRMPTRNIPVIILTARADEETKIAALDAGANDFLSKPFSITELHVRLKNLVESHHFQRRLAEQNRRLEAATEELQDTIELLKETESQLVQSEKMSSLGVMSAGIIHEINNPLNFAKTGLYTLRKLAAKPEAREAAEVEEIKETITDIEEGVGRVAEIVADLRSFTHQDSDDLEPVNALTLIRRALRMTAARDKPHTRIEVDVPDSLTVVANPNRTIQVLINLIQNSLDALEKKDFTGGGIPTITISSGEGANKNHILIRDNGPGIDPDHQNKIFDPFFTTKDVGQGMGLGLSICYRIMQRNRGRISLRSEPGAFCEFTLEFPVEVTQFETAN